MQDRLLGKLDRAITVDYTVLIIKEIRGSNIEEAKPLGACTKERKNPVIVLEIAKKLIDRLIEKGYAESDARRVVKEMYGLLPEPKSDS